MQSDTGPVARRVVSMAAAVDPVAGRVEAQREGRFGPTRQSMDTASTIAAITDMG